MIGLQLLGLGRALPAHAVTNDMLAQRIETSDEWITSRTGIKQRYFATEEETNTRLAAKAAGIAIENAGISKEDIAFCITATFTPDCFTPAVASGVAGAVGLSESAVSFDVNAACSGFLYGLTVAQGLLAAQGGRYALVVGSEVISRVMDMTDRSTCVLFGDGAAAAVVQLSDKHPYYFWGGGRPSETVLYCPVKNPAIHMDGQEVFRFATSVIPLCIDALLEKSALTLDEIDYVVCHQANARIIRHVIHKLHADPDKFYMNLERYGNTSAASIPLALSELWEQGLLSAGKKVLCVGFGAGLSYGGILLTF